MAADAPLPESAELEIAVNQSRPNELTVPDTFTTSDDFEIRITNGGKPVHLHLTIDDDLAGLDVETGNHFIPRNNDYRIPVGVDGSARPFHGKCSVSIGYGSETRYIEVRVPKPDRDQSVTVDESLAKPPQREPEPPVSDRIVSELSVLVALALGGVGLLIGAWILASVTTPLVGVGVVIVAMLIAIGAVTVLA